MGARSRTVRLPPNVQKRGLITATGIQPSPNLSRNACDLAKITPDLSDYPKSVYTPPEQAVQARPTRLAMGLGAPIRHLPESIREAPRTKVSSRGCRVSHPNLHPTVRRSAWMRALLYTPQRQRQFVLAERARAPLSVRPGCRTVGSITSSATDAQGSHLLLGS